MAVNFSAEKNQRLHYWTEFKEACSIKTLSIQHETESDKYIIWAHDEYDVYVCYIWTGNIPTGLISAGVYTQEQNDLDKTDFEDNYLSLSNAPLISKVQGRFERDDIVLKLANMTGATDSNGDLVMSILIPGTPGVDSRYVAGGYSYIQNWTWGDKISAVEVVDSDDILGYGAGTVLKSYHDSEVSSDNQGWLFYPYHGTSGEVEIEPMGWYGLIPAGFYLRVTFKCSANKNIMALIWWGKSEP